MGWGAFLSIMTGPGCGCEATRHLGGPDRPVFLVVETQVRGICFRALAQENISIIYGGFRERLGSKSVKLLSPMGSWKHDWVFL